MSQDLLNVNKIRQEKQQLDHWTFHLPMEEAKVFCASQAENEKSEQHLMPFPFCVAGTEHYI